jgi:hypothetical protein
MGSLELVFQCLKSIHTSQMSVIQKAVWLFQWTDRRTEPRCDVLTQPLRVACININCLRLLVMLLNIE